MANYAGDYLTDTGRLLRAVRWPVFGVDLATPIAGSPYGGVRFDTRPEFDAPYLPSVFTNAVRSGACCSLPINTARHARVYYSDTRYLFIPCPFRGGTPEYLAFYRELVNNAAIALVEARGESTGSTYTLIFANG